MRRSERRLLKRSTSMKPSIFSSLGFSLAARKIIIETVRLGLDFKNNSEHVYALFPQVLSFSLERVIFAMAAIEFSRAYRA